MPYTPTTWVEGVTTLGPTNMNKIEAGIASLSAPAPSTTPPASPADGDIWYYPHPGGDAPVLWQFRYNAGGATYKWEFVGGTPLRNFVGAQESTTNTGYTGLTTAGPSLTVPRNGDYHVELMNFTYNATNGSGTLMGLYVNGADSGLAIWGGANYYNNGYKSVFPSGLTAGWALLCLYKVSGSGTAQFGERLLRLTPIRVS